MIAKEYMVNERIRVPEVRLIAADGRQLGVQKTFEALRIAREAGMDLVLISPSASPPVAKVVNYGKFKYEMNKHDRVAKKAQKATGLKEIKLTPKIGVHDLNVRISRTKEFLTKKHRVKVSLYFRGREMTHREYGERVVHKLLAAVAELGVPEAPSKFEGRSLVLVLVPK